ncbi:alcohol dehydrogenase catalytic domain-containing protein [Methylobacterium haplocladii]|uniref:Alcohol dehydrogenase-like N-terminal domain-containing protein n=1 Tax=Methylobacterium haplocladii TaxID=1176176 RepID=A0A512ISS0_9HYPH|nr:alcohol dehydrogenase catalytic domain-containing protein [Methylobacterium haplocladii]GEP00731.1 hypothetical protein MHA02_31180 [Methylobacterium haplocladii]GLS59542.1 hypothetical protein GCM10007887_22110 [Methylobacterium haplocladii]
MACFEGDAFGSSEDFKLAERPVPVPAPHRVRIRIEATALGFVDGLMFQGRYQIKLPLPYIPSGEIAGVVEVVGTGVRHLGVGDRVETWQLGGGLSEFTVVAADEVEAGPADLPLARTAAMLVDYQTAHHALF